MTHTIGTEAIKKGTGKSWQEWVRFFDGIEAGELSHKEIAQKAYGHGAPGTRISVPMYQKAPGKVALSVQHEKLESTEQVEHWRAYWKELLSQVS
ncbi:MAG TPA: hypothetical protein VMR98_04240 [Candidatus Polarisedimenticolaceae bacterium]|nr:hypothetical protein [Candidatus Polarisedimenticolaceae bacterium]